MDTNLTIVPNAYYQFHYKYAGSDHIFSGTGEYLIKEVFSKHERLPDPLKKSLESVQNALCRAIEEGDSLKIGIVLGQTVIKLDELINL
jgi:hypothetical protein